MTDKEKIRNEVEKLKAQLIRGACASQIAMETRCKEEAYNEVLAILDSLQEEPVISNVNVEPIGIPAGVVELANVSDRKEEPINEEYHLTGIGEPRKATGTLGKMIAKKKEISAHFANWHKKLQEEHSRLVLSGKVIKKY